MSLFRSIAAAATLVVGVITTLPSAIPLHAEQFGKVSQPIILGNDVSVKRQRELGLVIVGGGCSGTLINRFWVLTASHCVSTDGTEGGTDQPFKDSRITATWTGKVATPTRYVRYWGSNNLDVALIFLGAGDLGPVDRKLIFHGQVDGSMTLTKFGIGFCAYATAGPPPRPAQADCGYRSARLTPYAATETLIEYRPNADGQTASFGDSGGPDFVTDGYGNLLSIAGVTSWGRTKFLPGMPKEQQWVSGEVSGGSAALLTIRDDIHRHMQEVPELIATRPIDSDLIVTRESRVATRPPSSYGDVVANPGDGAVVSRRSGPYSDLMISGGQPQPEALPYGPATCRSGFVWRVAAPSDLICVMPEARDRVAAENATAAERWRGGAHGRHSCKRAYVYREAFPGDDVCVTAESRDLVAEENENGPSRRVQP